MANTRWKFASICFWLVSLAGTICFILSEVRVVEVDNMALTVTEKRNWGRIEERNSVNVDDVAAIYLQKGMGRNSVISTLMVELKDTKVLRIDDFVNIGKDDAGRVADALRFAVASDLKCSYFYECIPRWKLGWLAIVCVILFCRSCASLLCPNNSCESEIK